MNPSQLPDSIQRIFSLKNDINLETPVPRNKGLDPAVIDEYSALRKNVEVVRNLQEILKVSSRLNIPECKVPVKMWIKSGIMKTKFIGPNDGCGRLTACW